tara:strand:+ start:383 stop:715 length:333 start_codon:yes stop_codon:yes gene_type:complete
MSPERFLIEVELRPKNPNKLEAYQTMMSTDPLDASSETMAYVINKTNKELLEGFEKDFETIGKQSKYPHRLTNYWIKSGVLKLNIASNNPQDFFHRISKNYNMLKSSIIE